MKQTIRFVALLLLAGCSREASIGPLEGTYGGTFQRGINSPAQVTITFSSGRYSGTVAKTTNLLVLSPIIGSGPFTTSGKTVSFTDETNYPATVDRTVVLNGDYTAEIRNGKLILQRNQDQYLLEKK